MLPWKQMTSSSSQYKIIDKYYHRSLQVILGAHSDINIHSTYYFRAKHMNYSFSDSTFQIQFAYPVVLNFTDKKIRIQLLSAHTNTVIMCKKPKVICLVLHRVSSRGRSRISFKEAFNCCTNGTNHSVPACLTWLPTYTSAIGEKGTSCQKVPSFHSCASTEVIYSLPWMSQESRRKSRHWFYK